MEVLGNIRDICQLTHLPEPHCSSFRCRSSPAMHGSKSEVMMKSTAMSWRTPNDKKYTLPTTATTTTAIQKKRKLVNALQASLECIGRRELAACVAGDGGDRRVQSVNGIKYVDFRICARTNDRTNEATRGACASASWFSTLPTEHQTH